MKSLKILGAGCAKCTQLAQNTETAAKELGLEYTLEKVTDIATIMKFGVMITPALVVDGKVKSSGRLLSPSEIKNLIA